MECARGSVNQIPPHATVSGDCRVTPFYKVYYYYAVTMLLVLVSACLCSGTACTLPHLYEHVLQLIVVLMRYGRVVDDCLIKATVQLRCVSV
jgi:hypothetical protein